MRYITARDCVCNLTFFGRNVVHVVRIRNPHEILCGKYKGEIGELDLIVQREVIGIFFSTGVFWCESGTVHQLKH